MVPQQAHARKAASLPECRRVHTWHVQVLAGAAAFAAELAAVRSWPLLRVASVGAVAVVLDFDL